MTGRRSRFTSDSRPGAARRALGVCLLLGGVWGCASTPPYQGLGGDELWELGVDAFEEEDWDLAIETFERLVTQNPGHPRSADARWHTAEAHEEKGEYVSAASAYERFLELYPNHGRAPEASLGICRTLSALAPHPERDQRYTRRARDACRITAREFGGMNVAQTADSIHAEMVELLAESEYREGRFYQRRGAHNSAILVFEDVARRYPDTDWAARAFLAMYRSYENLGWAEEADEVAARLLEAHPDSEAARELRAERGEDDSATEGRGGGS